MGASAVIQRPGQSAFDLNALNMALPPMPSAILPVPTVPNRDKEAQLSRRVKELEEEVRAVRIENEKQVRSALDRSLPPLSCSATAATTHAIVFEPSESNDQQIPREVG